MRKKLWKPFTIMIVPHSGKQVRSLSVSKSLIAAGMAFLLLIGGGGGYFFYKFMEYRRSSNELDTYKAQTEQLRNEYNSMAGTAEEVKQKLDMLQQLENNLRQKNGLAPSTDKPADSGGQGGVLQSRAGLKRAYMVLNKEAVDGLATEAEQRIASVQQTIAAVSRQEASRKAEEQRKQEQAARTPSIWPTGYRNVTSEFGYRKDPFEGVYAFHSGLDIAGNSGSPIVATADGTVTQAGWDGDYGISVVINHGNGLSTRYAHMSSINVSVGQPVNKGNTIGQMGNTGRSTGNHVHYEVLKNGVQVGPRDYLP